MDAAVAKTPPGKPWRRLAFALLAFVLFPLLPSQFQLFTPILDTPLLLVPIVAVCAIVGWLSGGRPLLAVIWVALAIWFLAVPTGAVGTPYDAMSKGWALLIAGSFGLANLWSFTTPFIVRALGAVALATGVGFLLAIASPGGLDRYERVAATEFSRRSTALVSRVQKSMNSKEYRDLVAQSPAFSHASVNVEAELRGIPARAAVLLPALLALESLAGLALGWAIFTRISPQLIGPPLSRFREFRFNDQLVWGVAVGGTLLMLPAFEEGRNAGRNLLVFFGTLYLIRGLGVLAWMTRGKSRLWAAALVVCVVLALLSPLLGGLVFVFFLWLLIAAAALLGLGDTWVDWRSRPVAG